jgi:glycine/D-amino acid oxidase-like deaminating enzyme
VWFRPEGRGFIAGAPPRDDDADDAALERVDHGLFDEFIWPVLAARVPGFERCGCDRAGPLLRDERLRSHGLAGALPGWRNVFTACGFSGHGMQQAPAVGSALAALIAGGTSDAPGLDALFASTIAG